MLTRVTKTELKKTRSVYHVEAEIKQDNTSNISSFGDAIVPKLTWEKFMSIYCESTRNSLEIFKSTRSNNNVICQVFFL